MNRLVSLLIDVISTLLIIGVTTAAAAAAVAHSDLQTAPITGRRGAVSQVEEYCERESFEAECVAPDQVIRIVSAVYGRMKLGRCVKTDYGVLGCSADVTTQVSAMCSGRHQCQFPITTLHSTQPCPSELMAYLEASYDCITVTTCSGPQCIPSVQTVSSAQGFLASVITESATCGSNLCPWILEPKRGQRFNLTFYSYVPQDADQRHSASDDVITAKYCYRLATVVDRTTMVTKDVTACGRDTKTIFLQTAVSARLEIRIFTGSANNPTYFLLHYRVDGCADPVKPFGGGWVKRNGDIVQVGCDNVHRTWQLTCSGTDWVGEVGSCHTTTGEVSDIWNVQSALERASTTTEGILAVIGLGVIIGVILGCSMLLLVVTVFKRRRRRQQQLQAAITDEQLYYSTDVTTGKLLLHSTFNARGSVDGLARVKGHDPGQQQGTMFGGRLEMTVDDIVQDYSSAGQQRRVAPPSASLSTTQYHCDHMYESPHFVHNLSAAVTAAGGINT